MRQIQSRGRLIAAFALLVLALVWSAPAASAEAREGAGGGREHAPGQVKKQGELPCPEGTLPDNEGNCFVPTCADGSEIPENGECAPPPCPDGAEICDTRSCPIDSPLPPGALCEEEVVTGGTDTVRPIQPQARAPITTVNSAEHGGGAAATGPAVSASVFGRPAEVLGVTISAAAPAPEPAVSTLPAVAATGAETTVLAVIGSLLIALGTGLVRVSTRGTARAN